MAGRDGAVAYAFDCEAGIPCQDTAQYTVQQLPTSRAVTLQSERKATAIIATVSPPQPPTPTTSASATAAAHGPAPSSTIARSKAGPTAATIMPTVSVSGAIVTELADTIVALSTLTATVVFSTLDVVDSLGQIELAPLPPATAQPDPAEEIEPLHDAEPAAVLHGEAATVCPAASSAHFDLIPIEGQAARDYPDAVHGDLNLALRGFIPAGAPLEQMEYKGDTDADAPRLHGLFEPNRQAQITAVYRVNEWIWDSTQCGGHPRGCPGPPTENFWPVTMAGLATQPGEAIFIPERGSQIYSGGFVALVLYAEESRLTVGYTRRDTVSSGYVVHLENLCVDPNLIALYQAQMDSAGWHASGYLPGIRNNQAVGLALGHELRVAIRDAGTFMDPRSGKDWWR